MKTKRCQCGAIIGLTKDQCEPCQTAQNHLRNIERKLTALKQAARAEVTAQLRVQRCLVLATDAGASLTQLGEAMATPRQTVRHRITRAKEALRASESDSGGLTDPSTPA